MSIKQTSQNLYNDQKVLEIENGASIYLYHQKGKTTSDSLDTLEFNRDNIAVNQALKNNWSDNKYVAILIKTHNNPARYDIKVRLVIGWYYGYFVLYCLPGNRKITFDPKKYNDFISKTSIGEIVSEVFLSINGEEEEDRVFDPNSIIDERKKLMTSIVIRGGQKNLEIHY